MPQNGVQTLKARYVFPVLGPPIPDGLVSLAGDRILAVGRRALPGPVEDLGSAALLPGLINAHTHLEFSFLQRPIGQPGMAFSQWVRLVVEQFRSPLPPIKKAEALPGASSLDDLSDSAWAANGSSPAKSTRPDARAPDGPIPGTIWAGRRTPDSRTPDGGAGAGRAADGRTADGRAADAETAVGKTHGTSAEAIARGLWDLIWTGTTAVADIAQPGFPVHLWNQLSMKAAVFVELRAPTGRRVPGSLQAAQQTIAAWQTATERSCSGKSEGGAAWQLGLSPHAPYTVRPELLQAAIRLAQQYRLPLAMHLAESLEEIQLLQSGQGPLRRLLEERGQWEPGLVPAPCRPLDYLRLLAKAERVLVIHGNYLDEEEWAFLAEHRQRMAVVFCPRSHAHFDHRPYPLLEMLAWGVRVILGTDSRASAPDTDMLAEVRWAAARFPQLAPQRILELATLEAAHALGWADQLGSLAPGRRADLVAVALPDRQGTNDPYELLLGSDLPVLAVWIAGQKVFPAPEPAGSPP